LLLLDELTPVNTLLLLYELTPINESTFN
jgi:hypothetical protein